MPGVGVGVGVGLTPSKGGGWTPLKLGASLLAWWTADRSDLITLSGAQVTSWRDVKAGYNMVQAVSAARPIYSATSWAGVAPSITLDGVDDELSCTDPALLAALPVGASDGELWALFDQQRSATSVSDDTFLTYGAALFTSRRMVRGVPGGVNGFYSVVGTGAAVASPGVTGDFTGRHAVRTRVNGGTVRSYIDGVGGSIASVTPSTTAGGRLRFGAVAHTPAAFAIGAARDLILTGPLSPQQEADLNGYLADRRLP